MIRSRDIAEKIGVSRQAVTAVLNGSRSGCVSLEKRRAILKIARELRYSPSHAAQVLVSGKTRTIGMIMPWVENFGTSPTFGKFLCCLTAELERAGYTLSVLPVPNFDEETIFREVAQTLRTRRVDGFILQSFLIGEAAKKEIEEEKIPAVFYSHPSDTVQHVPGICSVRFDEREAVRKLADFLRPHGPCASLLFSDSTDARTRSCFLQSLEGFTPFFIKKDEFFAYENASAAERLVRERWDELKNYKVWLAQNDRMAYGASLVVREHGLTPGRDILLAGFDNTEAGFRNPFFTTVSPPYGKMAYECVRLLLLRMETPEAAFPAETVIPAELIFRKSTQGAEK